MTNSLERVIEHLRSWLQNIQIIEYERGSDLVRTMLELTKRKDWEDIFLGSCKELIDWDATDVMSDRLQAELYPSRRMS